MRAQTSADSGRKPIQHSVAGSLHLDYSALSVNGASGLSLVDYTRATASDVRGIERLLTGAAS